MSPVTPSPHTAWSSLLPCPNLLRRPEGSRGGNPAPQFPDEEKLLARKKKNNINPIVSAPRSCLKNKNKLKLQLGRFSLASGRLDHEAAQWPCQLNPG